jgi:hypothetical protein
MRKIFFAAILVCLAPVVYSQQADAEELRIVNRIMRLKMQGLIPFRFANAVDGKPVAGGRVEIEGIGVFTTDAEGIISYPEQEDGFFTMVFSKPGFVTGSFPFEVKLSNVFTNRYSVAPLTPGAFYRFVLDWGEAPADLDLHLEKQGGYHISFRNMRSAEDGSALLDRDDQDGFGPETITVLEAEAEGVYRVYVADYSNAGDSGSMALAGSGAVVRVYGADGFLKAFTVPARLAGDRWEVCAIARGEIRGN